jgi:hypothetical protein
MEWLTILGLMFDIVGAVLLGWGTLSRSATWFRHLGFGEGTYERQHATWYGWIAVQVSRRLFAMSDLSNPENEMEKLSANFWGLLCLVTGFFLQLLGTI